MSIKAEITQVLIGNSITTERLLLHFLQRTRFIMNLLRAYITDPLDTFQCQFFVLFFWADYLRGKHSDWHFDEPTMGQKFWQLINGRY